MDLAWPAAKDQMSRLVSDLYQRIGFLDVGSARPPIPIHDFGHPHRGFETFPEVLTLRGLEDCKFDEAGLKARIPAPRLLEQLHTAISEYLNSDPRLHPEWYERRMATLKDAAQASAGINVNLEMRALLEERPGYRLEKYTLL